MVGKTGFEPATSWSQTMCTAKLCYFPIIYGAPEGIRTPDLLVRSQTLYPAELRAHSSALFNIYQMVAPGRIELPTRGFSVLCSTD